MPARVLTLLALALAVCLAGPARAWDDDDWDDDWDDDAPPAEEYEGALTPYGAWYDDGALGRVWRPRVAIGWAPYVDGRWAWTPAGWTWISYEPWAWTFHYGRWSFAPAWGWVWVPGTVWAPAWVSWWWGSGYVGWAPYGAVGFHHWHWVRDYDLCAPRVRHVVVHDYRVPRNVRTLWHGRAGHARPPGRHDIERVSRHRVLVHDRRPAETVAPWRRERAHRGGAGAGRQRDGDLGHRRGDPGRGGDPDHARGDRWTGRGGRDDRRGNEGSLLHERRSTAPEPGRAGRPRHADPNVPDPGEPDPGPRVHRRGDSGDRRPNPYASGRRVAPDTRGDDRPGAPRGSSGAWLEHRREGGDPGRGAGAWRGRLPAPDVGRRRGVPGGDVGRAPGVERAWRGGAAPAMPRSGGTLRHAVPGGESAGARSLAPGGGGAAR